MKKRKIWHIVVCILLLLAAFWAIWILVLGSAKVGAWTHLQADTCTGWSGRFVHFSSCGGYSCQGVSFGPFYTQTCNDPIPDQPQYPAQITG
jgi:hypothetical protein